MRVADVLKSKGSKVLTIRGDDTIETAVHMLRAEGVGALIVCQPDGQVAGIISERDIVRALADREREIFDHRVSDLMTRTVKTCSPESRITEVMHEMTRSRIRHIPVIEHGKLIGIVSIGDVVKNRLDELETETNVLRDYIVGRA